MAASERLFRLFIAACVGLAAGLAAQAVAAKDGHVLVEGSIHRVKKSASELPVADDPDTLRVGTRFDVRLSGARTLRGEPSSPLPRTYVVTASHAEVLKRGTRIYVLLDVSGAEARVVTWGKPQPVACLDAELIAEEELSQMFNTYERYDGAKCLSLR